MINKRVNYKRTVKSCAMSKSPNQSGLSIKTESGGGYYHSKDVIVLEGINPKMNDITSYLHLEIPIEHLDDVIGALTELRIELNKK